MPSGGYPHTRDGCQQHTSHLDHAEGDLDDAHHPVGSRDAGYLHT